MWLLLILVGGLAYVATMEPEMLAEWLSPYLGESTPTPVAMKPKPLTPAPEPPTAPAPQATPGPSDSAPAPMPPAASEPTNIAPAATAPPATAKPAVPATTTPAPMFGEGQKVTVTADANAPAGSIPLYADATANKPGPLVRTGVTLTVLDGDLQSGGWMYLVRTDEGAKGWVSEKRLRLKF